MCEKSRCRLFMEGGEDEPYTDTFETSRLKYVVTGPETSLAILLETSSEPRPAQGRRPTTATVAM